MGLFPEKNFLTLFIIHLGLKVDHTQEIYEINRM